MKTSMFDPSDPADDPHFGGRPPVLDEEKRRKIIAMLANGGGFATDPPNGLFDFDEDQSSQVFVVEAVQIVADPSSQTAA